MTMKKTLLLVVAMLLVLITVQPITLPHISFAAEEGLFTGSFTAGNASPSVNAPVLWNTAGTPAITETMIPQVQYNAKIFVTDNVGNQR